MAKPIILDGSQGEGGGQILRSALSLSMVTGKPFRLQNVRAGRPRPGLMRQHLTACNAAARICNARMTGASIGSTTVEFHPQRVMPGSYAFAIGSAGSATLVFQTLLPALLLADAPSSLTLEGGTHNPFAPPFDFIDRTFLPIVNRMGPSVTARLERPGFFPAGGGRFHVEIIPCTKLMQLDIPQRGQVLRKIARAQVAAIAGEVATRELDQVSKQLGWTGDELQIEQLPDRYGPGNILMLEVIAEHANAIFTAFGTRGTLAEDVAADACRQVKRYLTSGAPICACLADQLLIPFALAGGGSYATVQPTQHTRTNAQVIGQFMDAEIAIDESAAGAVVRVNT